MKVINFLILKNFSKNFMISYEFIWIYFELKNNKKSLKKSPADMAVDAEEWITCRHMAACVLATRHMHVCASIHMCAHR